MTPDLSAGRCMPSPRPRFPPPEAWLSDDPELREAAMFACLTCPVLRACQGAALAMPAAARYADTTVLAGLTPRQRAGLRDLARRRQPDERRARVAHELVRDPRRGDPVIAVAAGASRKVASDVRGELEAAGVIDVHRATRYGSTAARPTSPERMAARAQLLADASQSNRQAAVAAGTNKTTVMNVRHELEAAGKIRVYRGRPGGHGLAVPA